jgi:hypothetical protein
MPPFPASTLESVTERDSGLAASESPPDARPGQHHSKTRLWGQLPSHAATTRVCALNSGLMCRAGASAQASLHEARLPETAVVRRLWAASRQIRAR